jgi:hypothetical protein
MKSFVQHCDTKTAFLETLEGTKQILANTDHFPIAPDQEVFENGLKCRLSTDSSEDTAKDIYAIVIRKNIDAQFFFMRGAQCSFTNKTEVKIEDDSTAQMLQNEQKTFQFAPSLSFQVKSYLTEIKSVLQDDTFEIEKKQTTLSTMLQEIDSFTRIKRVQKNQVHWKKWRVVKTKPNGCQLSESSILQTTLQQKVSELKIDINKPKNARSFEISEQDINDAEWPDTSAKTLTLTQYATVKDSNNVTIYLKPSAETFNTMSIFKQEYEETDMIIVYCRNITPRQSVKGDVDLLQEVSTKLETIVQQATKNKKKNKNTQRRH